MHDAEIVVEQQRGVVRLLLELTEPELAWTSADDSNTLAAVLGACDE